VDTENKEKAIMPKLERTVDFYGDPISVAQDQARELYVPLRPLVNFLGLDHASQCQRVHRDEVLASRVRSVVMRSADGRQREQMCLALDMLPGWLFGIDISRVRPELSEKLKRYRAECFRVLWQAFKSDMLPAEDTASSSLLTTAEQNLEMIVALYRMA
jgi:hypothetical protein